VSLFSFCVVDYVRLATPQPTEWRVIGNQIDRDGRTIWIADAHRDDGKGFVVHADGNLTAFLELESAIRSRGELSCATFHPRHIARSHEQGGDFKAW
jgi:hypothetical protein